MSSINPPLQRVLDDFAAGTLPGGTQSAEYQNLIAAVTASPVLNERLNTAAQKGYLSKLEANRNPHAGASYNADATRISINPAMLTRQNTQKALIFQLGHEIQHGFYHYEQGGREIEEQTRESMEKIAAGSQAVKDYTPPLKTMLQADRENEALAMIAGWNAVVGYEQAKQPKSSLTLKDIVQEGFLYEKHFLDKPTYKTYVDNKRQGKIVETQGLKFNADMTLDNSQKEILAKTYFDQAPQEAQLGRHGESDYRNSYAGRYIGFIVREHYDADPKAKLVIDMKGLGLDERLLERNGLNLGSENRREAYYDKSRPKKAEYFDHTASGGNAFQHVPITTGAQTPASAGLDRLLQAGLSGDTDAFFKANREFAAAIPAARGMEADYRAAEAELAAQKEQENRRYALNNMPEKAQELHRQITEKLTEYAQEHNLPLTGRGLQNSINALTAEAYAKKLPAADHIALTDDNRLVAVHKDSVLPRFAEVDAAQAALSDPKTCCREILSTEQNLQHEAEQRELQRQAEQSRGMSIGR